MVDKKSGSKSARRASSKKDKTKKKPVKKNVKAKAGLKKSKTQNPQTPEEVKKKTRQRIYGLVARIVYSMANYNGEVGEGDSLKCAKYACNEVKKKLNIIATEASKELLETQ